MDVSCVDVAEATKLIGGSNMKWSLEVPKAAGWYWVVWKGYEYPEMVLVTSQENEIYACGQQYMIEPSDVYYWSELPVDKPELPWK